jgi:hypothetical protein
MTYPEGMMTPKQVEEKLTDLMRCEPFEPFTVVMNDGRLLEVERPNVAFDDEGAVFFGRDGGLVDFEFRALRAIQSAKPEAAA